MRSKIIICSIEECGGSGKLKSGLCNMHYRRWWRANNLEKARATGARYRAAHRENSRASALAYNAAHREEQRAYAAAYHTAHREERRAYQAAYRAAHPEKNREQRHRRRARVRAQFIAPVDAAAIYARDGGRCHICDKKVRPPDASMDHLVPISRGGMHEPANVRLAHLECNLRRHTRGPAQLLLL